MDTIAHQTTPDPTVAELIAAHPALSMHARDGLLLEEVPLATIARAAGTPCWVISAGTLRSRLAALRSALGAATWGPEVAIHYAMKANDHLAVLRILAAGGAGADVVSGGELARARAAGIAPEAIIFSGVGKTRAEMQQAIAAGIGQINVESAEELDRLSEVAAAMGATARIALRINPDVDADTHAKITTGRAENKFGIAWADAAALYGRAASLPGIAPIGLAVHIGSQILSMAPYRAAYDRVGGLVRALRAAGHAVTHLDCGGGLGISYRGETEASPAAFAGALRASLAGLDLRLSIEPGRWLAGPAGLLLASVIQEKAAPGRRFVVLDAAMNDLLRPALYDAWHGIVPLSPTDALAETTPADVVGPVCESGDTFALGRALPHFAEGALVALLDAGAYGAVMSSSYNARPPAAQVLVDGAKWAVIRARPAVETLWQGDICPQWL
jgi:diaminopimelate decarboxylase